VDAAFGYKIRRTRYRNAAEVSEQVASRDLKVLVDQGLLTGQGETKGRIYQAAPVLQEIYVRHYETRTHIDPFVLQK
jgi:lipoate synthase